MTMQSRVRRGTGALALATALALAVSLSVTSAVSAQTATTAPVPPPVVSPGVAAAQPIPSDVTTPGVLSAAPSAPGPRVAAGQPPTGPFTTVAAPVPAGLPRAGSGPMDGSTGLSTLVLAGLAVLGLSGATVERQRARLRA